MNINDNADSIYKAIKSSPHWRDDFNIEHTENANGIKVYYVSANDQDASTLLAIAQLNQLIKS